MRGLKMLLVIFFLVSCDKTDLGDYSFSFGERTTFKAGKTYISNRENLQLKLEVISDSRCPLNVMCSWAGEVSIKIAIRQVHIVDTLIIHSSNTNYVEWRDFSFNIHNVYPYPESGKTILPDEYSIDLTVSKNE